jgi:hypothetical protein
MKLRTPIVSIVGLLLSVGASDLAPAGSPEIAGAGMVGDRASIILPLQRNLASSLGASAELQPSSEKICI